MLMVDYLDNIQNPLPTIPDFYVKLYIESKISLEDFERSCMIITYKTSDNQDIIDNMPFYRFNNRLIILGEMLDAENGKKPGENSDNQENPNNAFKETMGNAKSMMKGLKPPSFNNFKLPK